MEDGPGHAWDERAADYDASSDGWEPSLAPATAAMLDAAGVGPGTRVLDLACGPGHTTAAAQRRGAHAVGLDVTPAMVEAATRRFPGIPFVVGDMRDPPSGPWDAIICRGAAHHVDPKWFAAAWRVLAPGGRLAIAEPGPTDAASLAKGMRPPQEWARLLESVGFQGVGIATLELAGSPAGAGPGHGPAGPRHAGPAHAARDAAIPHGTHGHPGPIHAASYGASPHQGAPTHAAGHAGHLGPATHAHSNAWPAGPMHIVWGHKP